MTITGVIVNENVKCVSKPPGFRKQDVMYEEKRAPDSEQRLGHKATKLADAVVVFAWLLIVASALFAGITAAHEASDSMEMLMFGVTAILTFAALIVIPLAAMAWSTDLKRRQMFMDRN